MNLMHFLTKNIERKENKSIFWESDQFPLDDESIADLALNAMLLVINNSQRSVDKNKTLSIIDYAPLVSYGVRFPWKERIALSSEIDFVNDELCDAAVIGLTRSSKAIFASAVYACITKQYYAHNIKSLSGSVCVYRVGWIDGVNPLSKAICDDSSNDIESIVNFGYAGVMPDGSCVGCDPNGKPNFYWARLLAYVQGMHNDRRYFWDVMATEEFWEGMPAKAHFSIDKEYVKSLFYARSVPVTDKGRLRPILHWVRCHKRRIKEGIDIDINKHLRGIDAFAMHGINFKINQPRKLTNSKPVLLEAA